MSTMDIVIIAVAALFSLIGIIKGCAKIAFGIFALLIIAVGCGFAAYYISPMMLSTEEAGVRQYNSTSEKFMDKIGGMLPSDGEFGTALDTTVTFTDGVAYIGEVKLTDAISEKIPQVGSFVASLSKYVVQDGETLRVSVSFLIVEIALGVIIWLVLFIILVIIRNVIRKKIFAWLDKSSAPSKIDRLLGFILSAAIALALIWGSGGVTAKFDDGDGNWANKADTFMCEGKIASPLMENNPLLKILGIELPIENAENSEEEDE